MGGARLGAAECGEVLRRPSSSVSGLSCSWARWIRRDFFHWKQKAAAFAASEFGSGCFKPYKKNKEAFKTANLSMTNTTQDEMNNTTTTFIDSLEHKAIVGLSYQIRIHNTEIWWSKAFSVTYPDACGLCSSNSLDNSLKQILCVFHQDLVWWLTPRSNCINTGETPCTPWVTWRFCMFNLRVTL